MTTAAAQPPVSAAADVGRPFAAARAVADAVLYEGYLLYPYRRSSPKNRVRWQFGVVAPRQWIENQRIPDPGIAGSAESWFQQVDALAEVAPSATLRVLLRFLQVQRRQVVSGDGAAARPVAELDADESLELSFDEAIPHEREMVLDVADLLATGGRSVDIAVAGAETATPLRSGAHPVLGSINRTSWAISARLTISAERARAPFPLLRLRLRVENTGNTPDPAVQRDVALRHSLLAAHVLLHVDSGRFLSALDPPAWAGPAAAECVNRHLFPVLAGAGEGADVLLAAPIILYDHPKIAPESPGDLHDATEIDEILSLRTLTLTEDEKREARATDPRAAAIVDRVDAMPAELLARLHGAVRELRPLIPADPPDSVLVDGVRIGPGSAVRLRPRSRGTDAHDMFLAGRLASVHEILHDVDGSLRLAVTVDDDPAAELHEWYGRFFHFRPDEVAPVAGDAGGRP